MSISVETKLTVFFEESLWVGVFERHDENGYAVCRVIFMSEPTPAELYEYIQHEFAQLTFSAPTADAPPPEVKKSFKKQQREARRQMEQTGVGSTAYEALREEAEKQKQLREAALRAERKAAEALKRQLRLEQKKEKKRGH